MKGVGLGVPRPRRQRLVVPLMLRIRPWGLGLTLGLAALLGVLACLPPAWAKEELFVANGLSDSVPVYPRTASGNTPPLLTLRGPATGVVQPLSLALAPSMPTAVVALSGFPVSVSSGSLNAFRTGDTVTYQASLTPDTTPTQVDIYLGALLPDGVTFLSLVQGAAGVISIALGRSPVPFSANVTLTPATVSFSHTFTGVEPVGTYFAYAGLVVTGSNPFLTSNQLSLGVQTFPFHCNFQFDCSLFSLEVGFSSSLCPGSVTISPGGIDCGSTCIAPFAPGTTVTLTAQSGTFAGWTGDCSSAGTTNSCTLVMATNKAVGAGFTCFFY